MTRKELNELLDFEIGKIQRWKLALYPEKHAVYLYRKSQYHISQSGFFHKLLSRLYSVRLVRLYGILASPHAVIGKGLRFVHPTSIVIGHCVCAGENLHIYQNVTLGGARLGDVKTGNQPILGNDVTVFCGAAILGKVVVGNNVIIAANSTNVSK